MSKEPVVSAQGIAALVQVMIMAGLAMAVQLGWLTLNDAQMGSIENFIKAGLALAVIIAPQIVAAFWARRKVTPLAAPRTKEGEEAILMPTSLVSPQMMQQIRDR